MEQWKTFRKTTQSTWEVSTYGRIKKNGKLYTPYQRGGRKKTKPTQGHTRYLCLSLNVPYSGYIHKIVAATFIPNPENKATVNHIDGNKHNNHIDNLEWATYKENSRHAHDSGLMTPRPKTIYKYKTQKLFLLTECKDGKYKKVLHTLEEVPYSRKDMLKRRQIVEELYNKGMRQTDIANELGVYRALVRRDLVQIGILEK